MFSQLGMFLLLLTTPLHKGPTPELEQFIQDHHRELSQSRSFRNFSQIRAKKGLKAFAEYEGAKYLLTSTEHRFGSEEIKKILAENMPDEITLILLAGDAKEAEASYHEFSQWIDPSQFKVFIVAGGAGFWTRDSLPVPSLNKNGELHLTDARYYHYIEPDKEILNIFEVKLDSHSYFFEGGNILADHAGNCFIVENLRVTNIPNSIFQDMYGCKEVHRFPHEGGIGHIDERVKILADNIALTDRESYKKPLEKLGYQVDLLPTPKNPYENYSNSLILGERAFVPSFGKDTDEQAFEIYREHGLEVIPIPSVTISNFGRGSVHCITMLYPEAKLKDLADSFRAEIFAK